MQQNGGQLGHGTLSNMDQTPGVVGPSNFNRLRGKPAMAGTGVAGQSATVMKNESPQKVTAASGKGGTVESPATEKLDEFQGGKRNQSGAGGRWGSNQHQHNTGGRNHQGGGGNWQQRNNPNRSSSAAGAAAASGGADLDQQGNSQNQQSPPTGGQQGNWQGGQSRGGQWGGQNRFGDKNSPQQQNDNESSRRGGPMAGRIGGGRGGRNESPQNRNYGGNRGGEGGAYGHGRGGYRGGYDKIRAAVMQMSGPQLELPPMEFTEKKFNANSRLFVGNLPRDLQEEELREIFSKYGELGQFYFNKEGSYAFINFDFRCNAEKAKRELQAHSLKGRAMKVRVASVTTGVSVKNLSTQVSNELLHMAFSVFGEVESCRVLVNERGKATGEGIVTFADKKGWSTALRKCEEECYFLTSDTRPCVVEPLDAKEEEEGLPEISMPKNQAYHHERQCGPRFADYNSFEFDYGQRYKRLFEIYKERKASLDRDFATELDQLEAKMAIAKHDFETEELRRELERREADMDRLRRRANLAGMGEGYGSGGGYGGSGLQQGQGYGGTDMQQFRGGSQVPPPSQSGYGGSPATPQGEEYQRGMKRQADQEQDTASGSTGLDGPNKFERHF